MNCKTCGYRLWNLPSRECPECGRPFAPGEFEFTPNEVQFVCPGCEQVYYGTSPTGHLVPPEFDCVTCGRHLTMDAMLLRPADWGRENRTAGQVNPWLDRQRRGRYARFFGTIGWGMARPTELMRVTPQDSSMGQAWWYFLRAFGTYTLFGLLPFVLFQVILIAGTMSGISGGLNFFLWPLWMIAVVVLFWFVIMGIWGAVTHLALIGSGATGTMRRTYQALIYTSGPMCVTAVPCMGIYLVPVGGPWWVISAILALREAHPCGRSWPCRSGPSRCCWGWWG